MIAIPIIILVTYLYFLVTYIRMHVGVGWLTAHMLLHAVSLCLPAANHEVAKASVEAGEALDVRLLAVAVRALVPLCAWQLPPSVRTTWEWCFRHRSS